MGIFAEKFTPFFRRRCKFFGEKTLVAKKLEKKKKIESKKTPICGEFGQFLEDIPRKRPFSIPFKYFLIGSP